MISKELESPRAPVCLHSSNSLLCIKHFVRVNIHILMQNQVRKFLCFVVIQRASLQELTFAKTFSCEQSASVVFVVVCTRNAFITRAYRKILDPFAGFCSRFRFELIHCSRHPSLRVRRIGRLESYSLYCTVNCVAFDSPIHFASRCRCLSSTSLRVASHRPIRCIGRSDAAIGSDRIDLTSLPVPEVRAAVAVV